MYKDMTLAQVELFHKLQEELGEQLAALGKVLSHGMVAHSLDGQTYHNLPAVEDEAGDVLAAMDKLIVAGLLSAERIEARRQAKGKTITRYMTYQGAT